MSCAIKSGSLDQRYFVSSRHILQSNAWRVWRLPCVMITPMLSEAVDRVEDYVEEPNSSECAELIKASY